MAVDHKAKRRYCGYCATVFYKMTLQDHLQHMDCCEKAMIKWYKKNKSSGKDPYSETDGESMEGGCK